MMLNAGRSARKMKRSLKWQTSFARLVVVPLALDSGLLAAARALHPEPDTMRTMYWICGVLAGFVVLRAWMELSTDAMHEKKRTARNYSEGGKSEFRDALRIHWGLMWRRVIGRGAFMAFHDRQVPDSRANIDHIVVNRTGVIIVDSKRWRGRFTARLGRLFYGNRDSAGPVDIGPTQFEAKTVRTALNRKFGRNEIPVRIVWAVDANGPLAIRETRYEDDEFDNRVTNEVVHTTWKIEDVQIIDHVRVAEYCSRGRKVLGHDLIVEVGRYLDKKFPPMK